MNVMPLLPLVVVLVATVTATITDIRGFKIPNALTLSLIVSGLAYHVVTGGLAGLGGSLLGMVFGFGILLPFFLIGGMGGGDVKLLAGIGAWLGLAPTFVVFLASSIAGGVYALALVLLDQQWRDMELRLKVMWARLRAGRLPEGEGQVETEVNRPDRRRRVVPYAPMMALGVIVLVGLRVIAAP